jgi:hypothetical protein
LLCTFGTRIDEAKTMGPSSLEPEFGQANIVCALMTTWSLRAIETHLAIDQIVVASWNWWVQGWSNYTLHYRKVTTVIPIGKHDGA